MKGSNTILLLTSNVAHKSGMSSTHVNFNYTLLLLTSNLGRKGGKTVAVSAPPNPPSIWSHSASLAVYIFISQSFNYQTFCEIKHGDVYPSSNL